MCGQSLSPEFCAYLAKYVNFCARDPVLGSLWRLGRGPIPFEKNSDFLFVGYIRIESKRISAFAPDPIRLCTESPRPGS